VGKSIARIAARRWQPSSEFQFPSRGGTEREYFVDGGTESLTADLSRISGSFVIGRNIAFTYKIKHVDLKQIGRDLN
jgi:TolB-like protein